MRTSKPLPPSSPDDTEAKFYDALQNADLELLMACWADENDVVCVHPGGQRQLGHAAVRAAFEAMFANGRVQAVPEKVRRLDAGDCHVHSVVERVTVQGNNGPEHAWVLATNVYVKTTQGWRMVAHHASPGMAQEPNDASGTRQMLH